MGRKDKRIDVCFSKEELDLVKQAAKSLDRPLRVFIRHTAVQKATRVMNIDQSLEEV